MKTNVLLAICLFGLLTSCEIDNPEGSIGRYNVVSQTDNVSSYRTFYDSYIKYLNSGVSKDISGQMLTLVYGYVPTKQQEVSAESILQELKENGIRTDDDLENFMIENEKEFDILLSKYMSVEYMKYYERVKSLSIQGLTTDYYTLLDEIENSILTSPEKLSLTMLLGASADYAYGLQQKGKFPCLVRRYARLTWIAIRACVDIFTSNPEAAVEGSVERLEDMEGKYDC